MLCCLTQANEELAGYRENAGKDAGACNVLNHYFPLGAVRSSGDITPLRTSLWNRVSSWIFSWDVTGEVLYNAQSCL